MSPSPREARAGGGSGRGQSEPHASMPPPLPGPLVPQGKRGRRELWNAKQVPHPMGEGRGEGGCAPKTEVVFARVLGFEDNHGWTDRKSTRLNSSHGSISYA